jgi:hypothetical protein
LRFCMMFYLGEFFQSFSEAMSMEKRYFTSDFRIRS